MTFGATCLSVYPMYMQVWAKFGDGNCACAPASVACESGGESAARFPARVASLFRVHNITKDNHGDARGLPLQRRSVTTGRLALTSGARVAAERKFFKDRLLALQETTEDRTLASALLAMRGASPNSDQEVQWPVLTLFSPPIRTECMNGDNPNLTMLLVVVVCDVEQGDSMYAQTVAGRCSG